MSSLRGLANSPTPGGTTANIVCNGVRYVSQNPFVRDPVRTNTVDRVIAANMGFGTDASYATEGEFYRSTQQTSIALANQFIKRTAPWGHLHCRGGSARDTDVRIDPHVRHRQRDGSEFHVGLRQSSTRSSRSRVAIPSPSIPARLHHQPIRPRVHYLDRSAQCLSTTTPAQSSSTTTTLTAEIC